MRNMKIKLMTFYITSSGSSRITIASWMWVCWVNYPKEISDQRRMTRVHPSLVHLVFYCVIDMLYCCQIKMKTSATIVNTTAAILCIVFLPPNAGFWYPNWLSSNYANRAWCSLGQFRCILNVSLSILCWCLISMIKVWRFLVSKLMPFFIIKTSTALCLPVIWQKP